MNIQGQYQYPATLSSTFVFAELMDTQVLQGSIDMCRSVVWNDAKTILTLTLIPPKPVPLLKLQNGVLVLLVTITEQDESTRTRRLSTSCMGVSAIINIVIQDTEHGPLISYTGSVNAGFPVSMLLSSAKSALDTKIAQFFQKTEAVLLIKQSGET